MLGITFIGSGSKGNSALLELNHTYYLLDAGISCKKICDYLSKREISLEELKGIFITHEHEDHIKGLKVLLKKAPHLKIYCTPGTASAIVERGIPIEEYYSMSYEKVFEISNCLCTAFKVPHDAAQPMGLHIEKDNYSMVMATDLGCVTPEVLNHTQNADLLCIESNYDLDMLKSCSYPTWLKQRIKSTSGHLPNEGVRGILSRMNKVPQNIVLMHLSQESNTKEKALESLESFLEFDGNNFRSMQVTVASQDTPTERLIIGSELPQKLKNKLIDNREKQKSRREAFR
ncbi:MAG: MBL fold metallo-hydrolase [Candidatus Riflebacteria bacterium]|nr:MBL fold metallo-hydrolase [Candidatus Riflebacteria bacterium]